jgi:hypothetical protein
VTLTATPAAGSSFTGWGGACSGTGKCTLTMNSDKSVTAQFTSGPPPPPPPSAPPDTKITKKKVSSRTHRARFSFEAIGTATGFQCRLKRPVKRRHKAKAAHFKACKSPKAYKRLKHGRYLFAVRAVGPGGTDPTPAKKKFRIR